MKALDAVASSTDAKRELEGTRLREFALRQPIGYKSVAVSDPSARLRSLARRLAGAYLASTEPQGLHRNDFVMAAKTDELCQP